MYSYQIALIAITLGAAIVNGALGYGFSSITVPLALPDSTPRMEYVRDRVVYNYGDYTVEVQFLPDGSADVFYDSGLLRAP